MNYSLLLMCKLRMTTKPNLAACRAAETSAAWVLNRLTARVAPALRKWQKMMALERAKTMSIL
jgi:hypothetical protein